MTRRHFWLLGLAILFLAGTFIPNDRTSGLAGNLAAGFLGSFLTVLLIDRALATERDSDRRKVMDIVARLLRPVLVRHLLLLAGWYKAASEKGPEPEPRSLDELFSDAYYETVQQFDLLADAPVTSTMTWLDYNADEVQEFEHVTDRIIQKYGAHVDSDLLVALESVASSNLLSALKALVAIPRVDADMGIANRPSNYLYGLVDFLRDHCVALTKLVCLYNRAVSDSIDVAKLGLLREDVAPLFGSARVTSSDQA